PQHGGKEVHRRDDRHVGGDAIDRGVVGRAQADEQVGLRATHGLESLEHLLEISRSHLGRTAGAGGVRGEPDLRVGVLRHRGLKTCPPGPPIRRTDLSPRRPAAGTGFTWSSARASPSRWPEPGSRTMRGSRWTSASVTLLRFAHACPAGTTTTSSSAIRSRARRVFGPGGAPTTPTSASPSSTHAVTWRLEPMRRQIEMSGYFPLNRPISAGSTYSPGLVAP